MSWRSTAGWVTRKPEASEPNTGEHREDFALIGKALTRVYGNLPDEPLPETLQVLVDRLFRNLSERS